MLKVNNSNKCDFNFHIRYSLLLPTGKIKRISEDSSLLKNTKVASDSKHSAENIEINKAGVIIEEELRWFR